MKRTSVRWLSLAALVLSLACGWANADNRLKLLPTPKVLKIDGGAMPLTVESRIVATDPKLKPLADILAEEILLVTKTKPAVVAGEAKAGDIVLTINPALRADADIWTVHGQDVVQVRDYAHTISVTDRVAIEGWDYRAVCEGTATLLQAIVLESGKASVPKMTVKDWPYSDYGAIMPDVARQYQPIGILKMAVETCRFYKIRYLHLHLSDDSAYTFPSTAYPEANSKGGVKPYTLDELKDLVAYADARGVTCVPELEGPGHCTSLLDGMNGKLGNVGARTMDVINPEIYKVLDTLVGEMCDVFKSSPYFHIGGDEVEPAGYISQPHVKKYMQEHNLTGESSIWLPYGQNMARIVKKHGKKTIMWDGRPIGVPLVPRGRGAGGAEHGVHDDHRAVGQPALPRVQHVHRQRRCADAQRQGPGPLPSDVGDGPGGPGPELSAGRPGAAGADVGARQRDRRGLSPEPDGQAERPALHDRPAGVVPLRGRHQGRGLQRSDHGHHEHGRSRYADPLHAGRRGADAGILSI
ncbi:MAG: family 20 glycosylhydrolase [Planctomycetota bacterium]|nr:family 20 glycosylhydrolase [Planctomycetota bacterium]